MAILVSFKLLAAIVAEEDAVVIANKGRKRLLRVREVCEALSISRSSAYELIQSGELRGVRVGPEGGAIRVPESELDRFLKKRSYPTS